MGEVGQSVCAERAATAIRLDRSILGMREGEGSLLPQVAAVIEQVEHERLPVIIDRRDAVRRYTIRHREDAFRQLQIGFVYESRPAQRVDHTGGIVATRLDAVAA